MLANFVAAGEDLSACSRLSDTAWLMQSGQWIVWIEIESGDVETDMPGYNPQDQQPLFCCTFALVDQRRDANSARIDKKERQFHWRY